MYVCVCPTDTGVHYAPALIYRREFQCLSLWSPHHTTPHHTTTSSPTPLTCALISHRPAVVPPSLNSACRQDKRGLICLPRLLSGSTSSELCQCVLLNSVRLRKKNKINVFLFVCFRASIIALWLSEWCH